jgi:hypothetical protein
MKRCKHGVLTINDCFDCTPYDFANKIGLESCNKLRAEGLKLGIEEAERLLLLGTQLGYKEAYLQAFKEFLIYTRPMYERVLKGEYPHPTTEV